MLFAALGFSQTDNKPGQPQKKKLENNSLQTTGPATKRPTGLPERKRVQKTSDLNGQGVDVGRREKPEKKRALKESGKVDEAK